MLLVSFSDPYSIKRISDANFRYEFYTTHKIVKPKKDKTYYWFKGGIIHNAEYGMAGELLHDKFVKMYHSNQLAEEGIFRKGLKKGLWKTWYPDGVLETTQYWRSGQKYGAYLHYDQKGNLLEKGRFVSDKKQGKWIHFINKDTIVYNHGVVRLKKVKSSNNSQSEAVKDAKKLKAETETQNNNSPVKEGFFKRLFKKKQPKQNVNG
jgi:hypothetical protein